MELQTSLLRGQDYLIYKGPYPHKFSPREKCYPIATQAIHLNRMFILTISKQSLKLNSDLAPGRVFYQSLTFDSGKPFRAIMNLLFQLTTFRGFSMQNHLDLNLRKRGSGADIGGGINFDGNMYGSREEITEQWAKYFKDLYTPSSSPDFDSHWEYVVRQEVEQT
ncbi:uncharacterized protein LOC127865082 [Dreissena polymorpha]|uniref:uncharacterized protein LOC127865082 n=1 Tax=Dreissena polymorpha TaxID=45954 RepID=UPI00226505D7|nr:uncharacterized protein LOC127865082 [Dreissena polymorpha]